MKIFDEETEKIRLEYEKIFNKKAPGINYDEFDNLEQYKQYLKELIRNKTLEK